MRLSLDLAANPAHPAAWQRGSSAAGKVIEAFGQFVVGGNYIVGFVIFVALIAIQYLVVSHGAVPHCRGHGAFHTRCHARQARWRLTRPEYRPHQRRPGPSAPRGLWRAKPSSAAQWTALPASASENSLATILNYGHQYRCRIPYRCIPAGSTGWHRLSRPTRFSPLAMGWSPSSPSLLVSVAGGNRGSHTPHPITRSVGYRQADVPHRARPLWIVSGCLLVPGSHPSMPKDFVIAPWRGFFVTMFFAPGR